MDAGRELANCLAALIELAQSDPHASVGRPRQFPDHEAKQREEAFHAQSVAILDALRAANGRAGRSGAVLTPPALGRLHAALERARGPGEGFVLLLALRALLICEGGQNALARQVAAGACARGAPGAAHRSAAAACAPGKRRSIAGMRSLCPLHAAARAHA